MKIKIEIIEKKKEKCDNTSKGHSVTWKSEKGFFHALDDSDIWFRLISLAVQKRVMLLWLAIWRLLRTHTLEITHISLFIWSLVHLWQVVLYSHIKTCHSVRLIDCSVEIHVQSNNSSTELNVTPKVKDWLAKTSISSVRGPNPPFCDF